MKARTNHESLIQCLNLRWLFDQMLAKLLKINLVIVIEIALAE